MKRFVAGIASLTLAACSDLSTIAPPDVQAVSGRSAKLASAYYITDLGAPGAFSEASGINESGYVVGYSSDASRSRYFAWEWKNGVVTPLPDYGGNDNYPWAVNDNNMAVGYVALATNDAWHAAVWTNGVLTDINPTGALSSYAVAVNNSGQVALYAQYESGPTRAFRWENGVHTSLGSLDGGDTEVRGMNERGDIVGSSHTPTGHHAFIWQAGVMTDLGTLGGSTSQANDVNDLGQVTGDSYDANIKYHAFRWENGVMTKLQSGIFSIGNVINNAGDVAGIVVDPNQLGAVWNSSGLVTLPTLGGNYGYAGAINEAGLVTAHAKDATGVYRAQVWQNGVMLDLGTLPGDSHSAAAFGRTGVNERGDVVGWSGSSSVRRAVLWRPAPPPEPVTCSVTPSEIWPANNQMVAVQVTIAGGGGIAGVTLRSVSNDETGSADVDGWDVGTGDLSGNVRASRSGSGGGRTYSLVYNVTTTFGERSDCTVTVFVPRDRGHQ